ncbi:hypothetical protein [uncultured Deefgea sp.]|uniref:hypothetical protein n=1 Tax=uncultured Deefgea sp. TaxID=1304914 RepID=UPI002594E463|nr:hypothetical protein [uncultured Deefgea sp.]
MKRPYVLVNIFAKFRLLPNTNKQERILFCSAAIALALLVIAEVRVPVFWFVPRFFAEFLEQDALRNIVSSISANIFAAYVFYIFIELIPRLKRRNETFLYLDMLLFVVLNAFNSKSLVGPTLPLSYAFQMADYFNQGLTLEFITTLENKLLEQDEPHEIKWGNVSANCYDFVAEAANNRLVILDNATSMANELSLQHGLIWSDIVDKLHQITLISPKTIAPLSDDKRRNILLITLVPLIKDWLALR